MSDNKVETELLSQIKEVLLKFPKYWEKDVLLRNKVAEDLRNYNQELIEALLSNQLVKDTYSISLNSTNIFKTEEFISMLRYKNYWENSYTKYSNEIGLTSEGKYFNYNTDVVLDFPHKDSVLEGGMSTEDQGKKEIYYHNILAKEEIDTLLSPKILTSLKRYDKEGEHKVTKISEHDNLIIKANNLIALHSLKNKYEGKVKLIYIDPPYNTGNDSFKYNDKFNRSTWLTFMKNRLEIAKSLLSEDGSIYVQIDNNEVHYLKVLMDEVFGENNFQREIIWVLKGVSGFKSMINNFVRGHDTILFYSKSNDFYFDKHFLPYDENQLKRFSSLDEDGRRYKSITKTRRIYLDEAKGIPISDVWDDIASFQTIVNAEERVGFPTQKPEKLIQRIIEASTKEGDLVLDFMMGSATTQAVAHKMGRQYIGIEQMDYINTVSVPRLQDVINGNQGGVSKDVEWEGGGSFVYAELASLNDEYIKNIQASNSEETLKEVLITMKERAYLNFKVDLEKVTSKNEGYNNLSLEEKKEVLIQVLDINQLYLSYSEMEDEQHNISEDVKAFNHSFYQKEGVKNE
ncbi:site-specific DNA-methyltransferase [Streptococcus parauberis]|uniref:site-specific DNA-methyltransferase n=1 Tax=Streptococcus parauberis TaxID=1348 RepID=UPI00288EFE91|nr:site-specific DNA-methyltransferase [Streptococcus parauberis]MDT2750282.1 site-specific DNA-methyltransferase [Streptococcus parauberis]